MVIAAVEPHAICAAVVYFNPGREAIANLRSAEPLVGYFVGVDNGSTTDEIRLIEAEIRERGRTLLRNPKNTGHATALNQAADEAIRRGFRWLLILDQDTSALPCMADVLSRIASAMSGRRPIGMVGSLEVGRDSRDCYGRRHTERREVITSGALLSLDAYQSVGPFRDDFFIDFVDVEYCLRLRRRGFRILRSCQPCMVHRIGSPQARRLLNRVVHPTNHSAIRRYYITRNRLRVWARYGAWDPGFVARDGVASAKELVKLLLFESNRISKLRLMARAIRDAAIGRMGPIGE